jgi:LysM repeat protein
LIPVLLVSCSTTQDKSDDELANDLVSSTFDETDSGDIETDSFSEDDFFEDSGDMDIEFIPDEEVTIVDVDPDYEALPEDFEMEAEVEALPGTSDQPVTAIQPPSYSSSRVRFPSGGAGYPEHSSGSYSQGSQGSYVVKKGDTLWGISRRFGTSVNAIASANNLNPNGVLNPGKNLVIPSGKGKVYSTSANSGGNTYVVKKGDSYFSIGKQFGISSQKLMAYNGAKSSLLKIGQTIRIP